MKGIFLWPIERKVFTPNFSGGNEQSSLSWVEDSSAISEAESPQYFEGFLVIMPSFWRGLWSPPFIYSGKVNTFSDTSDCGHASFNVPLDCAAWQAKFLCILTNCHTFILYKTHVFAFPRRVFLLNLNLKLWWKSGEACLVWVFLRLAFITKPESTWGANHRLPATRGACPAIAIWVYLYAVPSQLPLGASL